MREVALCSVLLVLAGAPVLPGRVGEADAVAAAFVRSPTPAALAFHLMPTGPLISAVKRLTTDVPARGRAPALDVCRTTPFGG